MLSAYSLCPKMRQLPPPNNNSALRNLSLVATKIIDTSVKNGFFSGEQMSDICGEKPAKPKLLLRKVRRPGKQRGNHPR